MQLCRFTFGLALLVALSSVAISTAHAQATRTWVSGVGDDANPCSRTAPCKTFAGAISKTAAKGEISTLDPGGFGAVTITKSITISGDGTLAGILAAGTNGVIVNAGVNDVVILRNLSIHGAGTGINGIRYLAGGTLIVEDSTISGFTARGIDVVHTSTTTPGALIVRNTSIFDVFIGARIDNGAGAVSPSATLDRVRISKAGIGFDVLKAAVATISNSVISNVTSQALVAENTAILNANNCVLTNNGTGISAFTAGATVRIANCDINNNVTGVNIAAGAFGTTFGNNRIFGNSTNITGTLTPAANN